MSTRSCGRGRFKKRVSTTLGKAASFNRENESIDLSNVRKPINTSVFGLQQVLTLFKTATEEVKRYITNECDIIYECRTCRSLYRSLANFILHKRSYCQESFKIIYQSDEEEDEIVFEVGSDAVEVEKPPKQKSLSNVLKKLNEMHEGIKSSEQITQSELTEEGKKCDNESEGKIECNNNKSKNSNKKICLEKIENTTAGVFQTVSNETVGNELIQSEVMEIHSMLNNNEAILQPDGKAFKFQANAEKPNQNRQKIACSVCNLKFSTKKTLRYHVKYKHNDTKLVYPCPECKETFANAWGVFRHLYKVHRKTTAQIRKLRDLVHANPIMKPQDNASKELSASNEVDRENQWVTNLEGDSAFQMCGGCGKRFERKAALHSHSQTCIKRMAVCNAKKPTEEKAVNKQKVQNVKGSKKRKPNLSRKLIKLSDDPCNNEDVQEEEQVQLDLLMEDVERNEGTSSRSSSKTEGSRDGPIIILHSDDEDTIGFLNEKEVSRNQDDEEEKEIDTNLIDKNQISKNQESVISQENENLNQEQEKLDEMYANLEVDLTVNGICQGEPEIIVDLTEDGNDLENEIIPDKETSSESVQSSTSPLLIEMPSKSPENESTPKTNPKPTVRKRKRSTPTSLKSKSDEYVDWNLLKCTPCNIVFTTNESLLEHMAMHFNWFRYQCKMCTFVSYNSLACSNHLQSEHNINPDDSESYIIPITNNKAIRLSSEFKAINPTLNDLPEGEKSPDVEKVDKGDPVVRKMIMEVIFGPTTTLGNKCQLRTRNCAKTLDKDFVYDMALVDTQIRKQAAMENKVKPIKIIKNTESDFKVINVSPPHQKKKK